jgi:hypothetical protein
VWRYCALPADTDKIIQAGFHFFYIQQQEAIAAIEEEIKMKQTITSLIKSVCIYFLLLHQQINWWQLQALTIIQKK